MKRNIIALALIATLAACGGGDDPTEYNPDPVEAQALLARQSALKDGLDRAPAGEGRDHLVAMFNDNIPMLIIYGPELTCEDKRGDPPAYEECRALWRSLIVPVEG